MGFLAIRRHTEQSQLNFAPRIFRRTIMRTKTNFFGGSRLFYYGYGMGEFGFTFFLMFIAYHLMYFMTDVMKMPADIAAITYTTIQWFEGITMVLAGVVIDRVNIRWGRYRPWMLGGAVVCAVCTCAFFFDPKLSTNGNVLYFSVFYFLAYSGYNLMWVSFRSIVGPLSMTAKDNVSLTTSSAQMGSLAGLLFSFFGASVLYCNSDLKTGYLVCAGLCGILMVGGMLISTSVCKPYDNSRTQLAHSSRERLTLRQILKSLNRPMAILFLAIAFRESISTLLPSLLVYYFTYVMHDAGLLSVYMLVVSFSTLFGQFIAEQAARRFGKQRMYVVSCLVSVVAISSINFVGTNVTAFMVLVCIDSVARIFSGTMIPAFMNEIADYNAYSQGLHTRSFVISLGGTALRVASIIGGALASFGLSALGYQPGMEATQAFCTNLTRLMTFSSAACIGIAAIVFLFYPLKPAVMDKIYAEKAAKTTDLLESK